MRRRQGHRKARPPVGINFLLPSLTIAALLLGVLTWTHVNQKEPDWDKYEQEIEQLVVSIEKENQELMQNYRDRFIAELAYKQSIKWHDKEHHSADDYRNLDKALSPYKQRANELKISMRTKREKIERLARHLEMLERKKYYF